MNRKILSISALLGAIVLTVAPVGSVPLALQQEATIERSFDVGVGGTLEVNASFGSIEIGASSANRLEVTVIREVRERYADDTQQILAEHQVEISESSNGIVVRTEIDDDARDRWRDDYRGTPLNVRFEITVPSTYDVDLETAGGSISVSDLDGEARAETSGGSLTFGNISGTAWGRTSGGSITIGDVGGSVDAETSGGSIRINRSAGEVRAKTSGGGIVVNEVGGTIEATTSGGSVSATITEQPQGDCRLSTSGGSVTVNLASGISLDIDARASGGRVSSDFDVDGSVRRNSIRGSINGGGPQLHLRTSGGSVRIRES